MQKIWTIARREYQAMVATKAFLLSIVMMPLLMFGSILIQGYFRDGMDTSDKRIVIVDGSGGALFADLQQAAERRNAMLDQNAENSVDEKSPIVTGSKFLVERFPSDTITDAERLELSNRARHNEIVSFVEIPSGVLSPDESTTARPTIQFYAANAVLAPERSWIDRTLNENLSARRLQALDIDPATIKKATAPTRVVPLGLFKPGTDGSVKAADESANVAGILVPFGFMMMMFMVIVLSAQPLIEGVIEEKSGRIAEVLLGSASSFQLMLGKLLGSVAGSLSVIAIYTAGGYLLARSKGWLDMVPMDIVPWFIVFQILAVLLFGSMFMAVGAAVNSLKEAQSLMLPIWLLMVMPMMLAMPLVREPNSTLAAVVSFVPPATPLAMVLRLASENSIPTWQPVAGLALLIVTTLASVYFAGRVFRIGILWQGKTPQMHELLRWAIRG